MLPLQGFSEKSLLLYRIQSTEKCYPIGAHTKQASRKLFICTRRGSLQQSHSLLLDFIRKTRFAYRYPRQFPLCLSALPPLRKSNSRAINPPGCRNISSYANPKSSNHQIKQFSVLIIPLRNHRQKDCNPSLLLFRLKLPRLRLLRLNPLRQRLPPSPHHPSPH